MIDEEELIQENIQNLDVGDIPIVSYFGSGSSLLGSILIKLGMDYIEGYQERIVIGQKQTEVANPFWRSHWKILDEKYTGSIDHHLRFFKAHHYPVSFEKSKIKKAVLLVRDGRDAALSYYNWRVGFANDKRSFDEFLRTNSYFNRKPFEDWALFCEEWVEWGTSHELHIVLFEDLKFNGFQTIKKFLEFAGILCSDAEINDALKETSFQKMRKEEDKNSESNVPSRIFRKGLIGEWRELYTTDQQELITPQARYWLNHFGYSFPESKIPACDVTIITTEYNRKAIEKIILDKPYITSYIITENFQPRHLEMCMGRVVINQSDHFEIVRSVDLVCRLNGLLHVIIPQDKISISDIQSHLTEL